MADPGAQVVRRIETGIHVRQVAVARKANPRRCGQPLRVVLAGQPGLVEARPEVELELQLRRVTLEEKGLEEDRRLRVGARLLVRKAEVLGVPGGLARDCLADVGVDLGQRMIAGEPAEGVGQIRIDTRVVESVAGFVEKGLIVVEPTLRAGDEVDHVRRIGRDHARARRLLRPVVEVETDVAVCGEVEAEPR